MKSKTPTSGPARDAASLRALDLDLILRFGSEIADGLHVITGETARREAARLRKEIAAFERLATSSVPDRLDAAATKSAPKDATKALSHRIPPRPRDRAARLSQVEAAVGRWSAPTEVVHQLG